MITSLVALVCLLQPAAPDIVVLSPADLPGLDVTSVERYEGKALYGYIDGAADLYNEYGFLRLAVERCSYRGVPVTLEIHEMTDDIAAAGIFTVSNAECGTHEALGRFSCVLPEAVQWAASRYFVRAINTGGSGKGSKACLELALALQAKLGKGSPDIPASLAMVQSPAGTLRLMRGRLGLENGFDQWSMLFDGFEHFELFVLPVGAGDSRAVVAEARFADTLDAGRLAARFTQRGGLQRHVWQRGNGRVILLEATGGADSLRTVLEGCPGCPR